MESILAIRASSPSGSNTDHNVELIALSTALAAVATLGLVARMVSKWMRKQKPTVDDYLLIASYILYVGETVAFCWGAIHAGVGHRVATLGPETIQNFSKIFFAASLLQPTLLALAKISILILYRSIFVTRSFRILVDILSAIVAAWWVAIFVSNIFICWPLEQRWDPSVPAHCGNEAVLGIIAPIPWILTDLAIILSPLPMIRKLNLPTRQRVALVLLFLIGGLSCLASIIRYQYVFYTFDDAPWETTPLIEWNLVEAGVTVLVVSLIAAKQAVLLLVPDRLVNAVRKFLYRSYLYVSRGFATSRTSPSRSAKAQSRAAEKDSNYTSRTQLPVVQTESQDRAIPDGSYYEQNSNPKMAGREQDSSNSQEDVVHHMV